MVIIVGPMIGLAEQRAALAVAHRGDDRDHDRRLF
jgi:hypothetical protein